MIRVRRYTWEEGLSFWEGQGIVFDRIVNALPGDRAYGSSAPVELEREIIRVLESRS